MPVLPLHRTPTSPNAATTAGGTRSFLSLPFRLPRLPPVDFLARSVPIPASLTLSSILADETCPPVSLRDFSNFLKAQKTNENLAFYMWLQDYKRRFAALSPEEQARSPPISPEEELREHFAAQAAAEAEREARAQSAADSPRRPGPAPWETIDLDSDDVLVPSTRSSSPCSSSSSITTPDAEDLVIAPWLITEPIDHNTPEDTADKVRERELEYQRRKNLYITSVVDAHLEETVRMVQRGTRPLSDEVFYVIAKFLTLSSPSALSSPSIGAVLVSLRKTTHPSAFAPLETDIHTYLSLDAHARFVRRAFPNTFGAVRIALLLIPMFVYMAGGVAEGLACVLVPGVARGWRAFSVVLVWMGVTAALMILSGTCPLLYSFRRRQLPLWELMQDSDGLPVAAIRGDGQPPGGVVVPQLPAKPRSLSFPSDSWARHPALREMQDAVFLGAARWGALAAVLWGVLILSVPGRQLQ